MLFSETPSVETLKFLFEKAQREVSDASVLERLRMVLYFAEHEYSISDTCRHFNISRSTFHRWIESFDPHDLSTLEDNPHDPLSVRHSTVSQEAVELIRRYRMRYTQMGKEKISELLFSEHAVHLSSSTVGRIIERECLYFADTPFHWKKRLSQKRNQREHVTSDAVVEHVMNNENALGHPIKAKFRCWKFLIVSSLLSNIVIILGLFAASLFEQPMQKPGSELQDYQGIDSLSPMHAAPPESLSVQTNP